jgi:hypothetical protein
MDFLDNLWDKASGVFDKVIDFESTKIENRMAYQQQQWEREQDRATAPVNSNWTPPNSDLMPWLIGAVVIGGGIMLLKK